jgi:hypothetical protein
MSLRSILNAPALIAVAFFASAAADAQPKDRADCERTYKPQVGQAGKDVVWVPTPDELVRRMLTMAKTTARDYVIDLGAGDGKIAIAAAREFGARALGIEYNQDMVKLANCMVQVEGVAGKVRIQHGDIFKEDFSKADIVTMYLLPELNLCVRHRLLAMKPGTRVTSHQFTMGDWSPDQTADIEYRSAYLWIVPARVGGNWRFRDQSGDLEFNVRFEQNYQKISGEAVIGGAKQPLVGATLSGDQIHFAFNDSKGVTRTVSGTVSDRQIAGTIKAAGAGESRLTGSLQGKLELGGWVDMAYNCDRFYR